MTDLRLQIPDRADDTSVIFTDGVVVRRDAIVIPAQLRAFPDATIARILFLFGDKWFYHDFDDADVRSVTYRDGICYLMGMNGVVYSCGRSGAEFSPDSLKDSYRKTVIQDASKLGALFRIRFIGEDVYTCGQSSQVYRLRGQTWERLGEGLLEFGGITLEDIDGTGADDIYAVGWHGSIFHFDGRRWTTLDSPTNQHLSNVRCVSRDEVYICGNAGSFFRGNRRTWNFVGDSEFRENFWGMAAFGDEMFIAYSLGIKQYNGGQLTSMPIDVEKPLNCNRLHSADGVLWSFGDEMLLRYDGAFWEEVICPENE